MQVKEHRSPCPVACTLDLIGDRWTLLIVRDMMLGRCFFSEFAKSPERIATNILASRLKLLVAAGIAEVFSAPSRPKREGYRLTEKGAELGEIVNAHARWGLKNIEGTAQKLRPLNAQ